MTATATIFRLCSQAACERSPTWVTPYPKRIIAKGEGVVSPSQAAIPPVRPAAQDAKTDPDLAAGWSGQELAKGNDVGKTRFVEPAALLDEFSAEITEMRDWSAKWGQSQTKTKTCNTSAAEPRGPRLTAPGDAATTGSIWAASCVISPGSTVAATQLR